MKIEVDPMIHLMVIFPAVLLLAGLLYFEKTEGLKGLLPTKTALSCLFIVAALIQPHPNPHYYALILLGLMFCLGGDVFLALPQKKMFTMGLFSFLIGHLFYIVAFFYAGQMNLWTWVGSGMVLLISGGVYIWLWPHLEAMKIPVLFYVVIISVMVAGAWTILGDPGLPLYGSITVFVGAFSFYLSDVFVARDRFIQKDFINRLVGLPMYYGGQFLLAFSVGLI
jgi:uncharacterized membrane protein YhhN